MHEVARLRRAGGLGERQAALQRHGGGGLAVRELGGDSLGADERAVRRCAARPRLVAAFLGDGERLTEWIGRDTEQ